MLGGPLVGLQPRLFHLRITPSRPHSKTKDMNLTLNEVQLTVLQWVAAGCDMESPPTPSFKTTAPALHHRGLIELDRRRGHWHASLAEKGAYYLEHGHHPDAPEPKANPSRARISASARLPSRPAAQSSIPPSISTPELESEPYSGAESESKPPLKHESIPMPSQIRKPHAAVRELVDHRTRLDVSSQQRQRGLTILHALVQEASRRGWTITPVLSEIRSDSWTRARERVWPSADLFTIDAGHNPAAIRLRMKLRQVAHVPTKEEIEKSERWGYQAYTKNDLVPTERMRLEIGAGSYGSLVIEDTAVTRIEDKLLRAINRIQSMTDEAIRREEQRRLRETAEAEARNRAELLRQRATIYGHWVKTLEDLNTEVAHHHELRSTLDDLRAVLPRFAGSERYAELEIYLEWAEQHLTDSDPIHRIPLPNGNRPDLTNSEWRDWNNRNPRR